MIHLSGSQIFDADFDGRIGFPKGFQVPRKLMQSDAVDSGHDQFSSDDGLHFLKTVA
jgi:hypothetical protein